MSIRIAGTGWVTPLGSSVTDVWTQLLQGVEASVETIADQVSQKSYPVFRVPASALKNLPRHPRLRRASAISRFAVAAGLAALEDAKSTIGEINPQRTALIFGVANGGVVYTKRFYHDIINSGAQAASPLLFPETVFNAPASHLAAILGINGASYTVVADGAVGILAIEMAHDLLASDAVDHCLVVAAEEADWLLCDAYHHWRMLRAGPPIEPFGASGKGTILSEGAGAVLLGRQGHVKIERIHPGGYFTSPAEARDVLKSIVADLAGPDIGLAVLSANGTFIDHLQANSIAAAMPEAQLYSVAPAWGEGVGAGALWQVILATQALRTQTLPPLLHAPTERARRSGDISLEQALVISCGLNQQAAGLRLCNTSTGESSN